MIYDFEKTDSKYGNQYIETCTTDGSCICNTCMYVINSNYVIKCMFNILNNKYKTSCNKYEKF